MQFDELKSTYGGAIHELLFEVMNLAKTINEKMDEVHNSVGLSTPEGKVIRNILTKGDVSVPDIAYHLRTSRQFIQKTCNDLEGKGYVTFEPNPRHKTSKLVKLTENGKEVFLRAKEKENTLLKEAMPKLNIEDINLASEILNTIHNRLLSGDYKY